MLKVWSVKSEADVFVTKSVVVDAAISAVVEFNIVYVGEIESFTAAVAEVTVLTGRKYRSPNYIHTEN